MIIFREDLYGMDILVKKKYRTKKNRGLERCVLVRYMNNNGYSKEEIISSLKKMSHSENPYLSKENREKIFNKIYDKALNYEYIKEKEVTIYKDEINKILEVPDKNARNLLFINLVYYKWGKTINHYKFYSKNLNKVCVKCQDKDILSLSKLDIKSSRQKSLLFNYLIKNGLYKTTSFKNTEYFYIPFAQENGEVAFVIDNFDDLILWMYSYLEPLKYKKCEECGRWIKKTTGSKKYCASCAKYISNQQKKIRKVQSPANPLK